MKEGIAVPRPPIVFDYLGSIKDVYYWWKSGDWPMPGSAIDQMPKVKFVLQLIVDAERALNRSQALRHELIIKAFGG